MNVTVFFITMLGVAIMGFVLGGGMEYDYNNARVASAFGCGRFYAGNFDPADDPRDEHSRCYPYYKAWEPGERWPSK